MRKKVIVTTAVAGLAISGFSLPAYAADYTQSENLTVAALSNLGVNISDSSVLNSVAENVSSAIDAGIVDENILDTLPEEPAPSPTASTDPIADPTVTPTEEPTPAPTDAPTTAPTEEPTANPTEAPEENELDKHLKDESANWDKVQADWTAAFATVKTEFDECVAAGTPASECAQGLGFKLQVAHAQVILNSYDARVAAIAELPEDQQAEALAELEEQRQRTVDRLAKAQELLADHIANGTPLPKGVKIKNVPGEADLVNGLLASLGSDERVIPKDAEHVRKNPDGTVAIEDHEGGKKPFSPEKPNLPTQRDVEGDNKPQGGNSSSPEPPNESSQPRPSRTSRPENPAPSAGGTNNGSTENATDNKGGEARPAPQPPKPEVEKPRNEQKPQERPKAPEQSKPQETATDSETDNESSN